MKANHWSVGIVVALVTTIALIPFLIATTRRPTPTPMTAPSQRDAAPKFEP
jgi:hypothetical protein